METLFTGDVNKNKAFVIKYLMKHVYSFTDMRFLMFKLFSMYPDVINGGKEEYILKIIDILFKERNIGLSKMFLRSIKDDTGTTR